MILDYVNESRKKAYDMKAQIVEQFKSKNIKMGVRMLLGTVFMELRRNSFNNFYSKYTKRTDEVFETLEQIKSTNDHFDFFMVGSDQVWNPINNGGDETYLLGFVNDNTKKISYASSFGMNKIPIELRKIYKHHISTIKSLSTREKMGVDIIKDLTQREADLVLDPVFLLSKDAWIKLIPKKQKNNKFLFVYTNRNNQYENLVRTTNLSTKGYKVHKISRFLKPKDFVSPNVKVDYFISPEMFISNILNANLVITASFHCVAFSIIFQKKFVVFLTGDKGKDERIENLLRITGLESRIYNESLTEKDLYQEIDYNLVHKKLQPYIDKSKSFLIESLK